MFSFFLNSPLAPACFCPSCASFFNGCESWVSHDLSIRHFLEVTQFTPRPHLFFPLLFFSVFLTAAKVGSDVIRKSKIHLVDLAGSERVYKTGTHIHIYIHMYIFYMCAYVHICAHFYMHAKNVHTDIYALSSVCTEIYFIFYLHAGIHAATLFLYAHRNVRSFFYMHTEICAFLFFKYVHRNIRNFLHAHRNVCAFLFLRIFCSYMHAEMYALISICTQKCTYFICFVCTQKCAHFSTCTQECMHFSFFALSFVLYAHRNVRIFIYHICTQKFTHFSTCTQECMHFSFLCTFYFSICTQKCTHFSHMHTEMYTHFYLSYMHTEMYPLFLYAHRNVCTVLFFLLFSFSICTQKITHFSLHAHRNVRNF